MIRKANVGLNVLPGLQNGEKNLIGKTVHAIKRHLLECSECDWKILSNLTLQLSVSVQVKRGPIERALQLGKLRPQLHFDAQIRPADGMQAALCIAKLFYYVATECFEVLNPAKALKVMPGAGG